MLIRSFRDLDVYVRSKAQAMELFHLTESFPKSETYSLTDQIRRSSRSVAANIAEAWGKRRYANSFVAKLSDSEAELYETQAWLDFSLECGYITDEQYSGLQERYEALVRSIVGMITYPDKWCLKTK